jgi:hypothetical protein
MEDQLTENQTTQIAAPEMFPTSSGRYDNNKTKTGIVSTMQRLPYRNMFIFLLMVLVCYFGFQYMFVSSEEGKLQILAKDRSSNYRVKVLPSSLTDEQLNDLPRDSFSYLAMIDAGSSGCRAHVYRYAKLGTIDGPLYVLPQHNSKKVKPGLSTFVSHPDDAGQSLKGLIDFLKEQVPESDWSVTPIWLKATAGLRMVKPEESDAILTSVRSFLSDPTRSHFLFRSSWARIISGTEEGGFGWIAFNYLKKIIGPKRNPDVEVSPYAVIEMGGASAQVSQLAPTHEDAVSIPPQYRFSFNIEGEEYTLYTHSYLGYGAEQAKVKYLNKLVSSGDNGTSPCDQTGSPATQHRHHRRLVDKWLPNKHTGAVFTPTSRIDSNRFVKKEEEFGNEQEVESTSAKCMRTVSSLFGAPAAPAAAGGNLRQGPEKIACPTNGPHSFDCVYQPAFVAASTNILAFENFFYMSSALGVAPATATPSVTTTSTATTFPLQTTPEHILASSQQYCSLPWADVEASYPKDAQPKDVNEKMCFLSAFSYSFLVDGLHILPKKIITIQKEVDGSEIEWALGAAYKETADFLKRTNLRPT